MPAKAGIQNYLKSLDSRLRGNDVKGRFRTYYETIKLDNLVKSRIFPFFWIPAFAGMTIRHLISDRYHRCLAREGGYPVFQTTFAILSNLLNSNLQAANPNDSFASM
jgi:hypothetical protein